MGITRCCGEVSGPPAKTHVGAEHEEGTATATWIKAWDLVGQQANPPNAGRVPNRLGYLQHYALDMAYIAQPGPGETPRHLIGHLYKTLQQTAAAGRDSLTMRVVRS